jgi:hypothetical protein
MHDMRKGEWHFFASGSQVRAKTDRVGAPHGDLLAIMVVSLLIPPHFEARCPRTWGVE